MMYHIVYVWVNPDIPMVWNWCSLVAATDPRRSVDEMQKLRTSLAEQHDVGRLHIVITNVIEIGKE